jgi:hypothetical protein
MFVSLMHTIIWVVVARLYYMRSHPSVDGLRFVLKLPFSGEPRYLSVEMMSSAVYILPGTVRCGKQMQRKWLFAMTSR